MNQGVDTRWGQHLALSAVLAAAAAELLLRRNYHQMAAETGSIVLLIGVWLVLSATLWGLTRLMSGRAQVSIARLTVLLALAWYIHVVFGAGIGRAIDRSMGAGWLAAAFAALSVALALRLRDPPWERTRRALVFASVAFVASQPLLATYRSSEVDWPPAVTSKGDAGTSLTIFLLLDEMNAKAAQPLVAMLLSEGLHVDFRPIRSAGEHTLLAVPAMFIKKDFAQARPCSFTSVCSDRAVLDFGRVRASRDDIDVVGFFHPYCAMQGLRSCAQITPRTAAMRDVQRWRCAVLRRLKSINSSGQADCDREQFDAWKAFVDESVGALWAVPAWKQGGFVFAHLPLPHPPGPFAGVRLNDAYASNVERATNLVRDLYRRIPTAGFSRVTIVVFSDHPLRLPLWCSNPLYAGSACGIDPNLSDTHTPLIVASTAVLPELTDVETNAQIFDVVARLSP